MEQVSGQMLSSYSDQRLGNATVAANDGDSDSDSDSDGESDSGSGSDRESDRDTSDSRSGELPGFTGQP